MLQHRCVLGILHLLHQKQAVIFPASPGWKYGLSAAAEALLLHLAEATSALCNSADVEVSAVCMAMPVCQHGSSLCRPDYQSHSCCCKEVKLTIFNPNFLRIQSLFPQLLCHRKTFTEQTEKEENET